MKTAKTWARRSLVILKRNSREAVDCVVFLTSVNISMQSSPGLLCFTCMQPFISQTESAFLKNEMHN